VPFKLSARLKTFDYTGFHRYFLTICTRDRRLVFTDGCHVQRGLAQIRHTSEAERFAVIAYCFMPDHLHALVEGTNETADFRAFVRLFKQRSSFHSKCATGGGLWQRGYFERVLRAEEDTFAVARYLLCNPVRAGLVESPEEYPFLGSLTMSVSDLLESVQARGRRT